MLLLLFCFRTFFGVFKDAPSWLFGFSRRLWCVDKFYLIILWCWLSPRGLGNRCKSTDQRRCHFDIQVDINRGPVLSNIAVSLATDLRKDKEDIAKCLNSIRRLDHQHFLYRTQRHVSSGFSKWTYCGIHRSCNKPFICVSFINGLSAYPVPVLYCDHFITLWDVQVHWMSVWSLHHDSFSALMVSSGICHIFTNSCMELKSVRLHPIFCCDCDVNSSGTNVSNWATKHLQYHQERIRRWRKITNRITVYTKSQLWLIITLPTTLSGYAEIE